LLSSVSIRPLYVLEKTVATFGTFFLLYQYTEHYIMPYIPTKEQTFWRSMLDLVLPFMARTRSSIDHGLELIIRTTRSAT